MPISPVNQLKNAIIPVNTEKGSFYLLCENGDYLTLESGDFILLDGSASILGINEVKNAVSPINQNKS